MHINHRLPQPILRRILIPMVLLTLIEVMILAGTFIFGGAIQELDGNAKGIMHEKVTNRTSYLQNEMINSWSNVSYTVQNINAAAEQLTEDGLIDLNTIGDNPAGSNLLSEKISDHLIDMLRSNKVTGVFAVFNNKDASALEAQGDFSLPGICFRDLDPDTTPSTMNNDLLIERGSVELVRNLGIATDGNWKPQFEFTAQNQNEYQMILNPLGQAVENSDSASLTEWGYWSRPHTLTGDDKKIITYTVPLVSSDGIVYGVLGTEVTLDYLAHSLPSDELMEDRDSAYLLTMHNSETGEYEVLFSSDESIASNMSFLEVKEEEGISQSFIGNDEDQYFMDTGELKLYDSNVPFESEQWGLSGAVKERDLTEFSRHILSYIILAIFLTVLIGVVGCIIVSIMISRPVYRVSRYMQLMDGKGQIALPRTNIYEFDLLAASVENLSRDVIDSATKFTQILNKASIRIAGFEIDLINRNLFITDDFFSLLGADVPSVNPMGIERFGSKMKLLDKYKEEEGDDYILYKVYINQEETYIRLSYSQPEDGRYVGAIEDITRSIHEKQLIEHERDHDLLTGLKNRRAFQRIMQNLFQKGDTVLKKAALVMLDLDNLKHINDKYGHDYGDKYIQAAAEGFRKYTPTDTLISRNSGDEFYIFFYGFETEAEIETLLQKLKDGIDEAYILLPSMHHLRLSMSGGVSWYPKDTEDYEKLVQYSDFAMYQIKHSTKGTLGNFDLGAYHSEEYVLQSRRELTEMLESEKLEYCFQPIVDAHTGEIFAYEALMRGMMPTLKYPSEILSLAREERKLSKIEEITWQIASKAYMRHLKDGKIKPGCKIFINSLPDYNPSADTIKLIESLCRGYLSNFVIEITEDAEMEKDNLDVKRIISKSWNCSFALDDYGSGYNGDKMLIQLAPQYIKIDRAIISGIHLNVDKQKVVENTISYAVERDIKVIAEGIETEAEMNKVIELGVDYLQGYYLAHPKIDPPLLREQIVSQILQFNSWL